LSVKEVRNQYDVDTLGAKESVSVIGDDVADAFMMTD
jgi:hypothetical protein